MIYIDFLLYLPTLTCGVFVFSSVSAFLRLPPPPPVLLFTHPPHSLTHSLTHAFAWQAWDNVHCQGVGCTPWRPSGVPWAPLVLRGRRGTMCTAKGSNVRPSVPSVSLGLGCFCVAGVGQCALPRGRMYALASLRCSLGLLFLRCPR